MIKIKVFMQSYPQTNSLVSAEIQITITFLIALKQKLCPSVMKNRTINETLETKTIVKIKNSNNMRRIVRSFTNYNNYSKYLAL